MGPGKSRAQCQHCHHEMVPRVVFRDGELSHSICPFCGKMYKDFTPPPSPFWGKLGWLLGKVWKMAPIEAAFIRGVARIGVNADVAKKVFTVLKVAALLWLLAPG